MAWKLITPEQINERWLVLLILLTVNTTLWWFSRTPRLRTGYYQGIILLQILMYVAIATYSIYTQRGMASNAIVLYSIPILITALIYNAYYTFITTFLCIASYCGAAIMYFKKYPSEGYKVELYGELVFYCFIIILIAMIVLILSRNSNK